MSESENKEGELQQGQEAQTQQALPGKRLAEARESAGLSRAEVAAQMRINERMIAALEADEYDSFPSVAYVRGYLRSYARILGLPETEFSQPLDGSMKAEPALVPVGHKEQVSSRALPVRLVTYLLIGVVLISVGMWFYTQRNAPITFSGGPQNETGSEMPDSSEPSRSVEPSALLPGEGGATGEPAADDETQGPVSEGDDAPAEPAAADTPAPTVERRPAEALNETPPEEAAAEQEGTAPVSAATPVSRLELHYQKDSWTEVSDNAGRQLAYGLIKANRKLELKGEAPFRVFLGYAPGVTVYYNDELFDHSAFQRRDVARFRVGRTEHNQPGSR